LTGYVTFIFYPLVIDVQGMEVSFNDINFTLQTNLYEIELDS